MGVESCESYGLRYPDRCISHLEFNASERERVLSGESELLRNLDCSCYELNCTARVAEITIEFREQPTNPSMSDREMETTPVSDESAADALSHVTITIVILAVAFGIICIAFVVMGVVCCRRMFKTSSTVSTTTQIRLDDQPNDQPWQLINQIGQGRFGYVYKARYCNNIVAVKIFTHHSRTAWETECTLNSMESTAHENIVEFVTKESRGSGISLQLVIITRYYQLGSLNQFLRSHVVSLQQANVMINSVANGLAHLHADYYTNSNGIVAEKYAIAHRDMKSANVLVKNENGDCVIGDLGFAMILDPSLDSKELASTGQVGTFRYMAPEVLDTRVHLLDLQSFKQIDVYAFSLIMWEVMSRCCILNVDDVPAYHLPYEELAGTRPSLDTMKDIVVTRKLRPALPPMWANDECLKELYETLVECWDEDPEARLSAANVIYRMEEFTKELVKSNRSSSSNVSTQYNTMATSSNTMAMVSIGQPMECSQSSPPPYYSPTDPNSYHNPPGSIPSPPRQHFFPDSMSIPTAIGRGGRMGGGGYGYGQPIRMLRNSACSEEGALRMNAYNSHEPLSVRNSLILGGGGGGGERRSEVETDFGVLVDGRRSLIREHGDLNEMQGENEESSIGNEGSANGSGLVTDEFNLNSDSGVQNLYSNSVTSASSNLSPSNSSVSRSRNSVVSNLSDELLSKHELPESSTDTLDMDHQTFPTAAASNIGGAPEMVSTNSEFGRVVPVENSGNSVSTVTSV